MDIYKYDYTTKEWYDICNSNLKYKEREIALNNYIKRNGEKVSLQEYFKDNKRNSWKDKKHNYKCFGDAENCLERLAKDELDYDSELVYCSAKKNNPEDLVEGRCDWDDMKSYADGLYYFIESLKDEIARGEIIINQN